MAGVVGRTARLFFLCQLRLGGAHRVLTYLKELVDVSTCDKQLSWILRAKRSVHWDLSFMLLVKFVLGYKSSFIPEPDNNSIVRLTRQGD
jgi:hypothetical protein